MSVDPLAGFSLEGKVAIVTGASAGLGARFARVLDAAGARIVLAARRVERLEALALELHDALPVACDLADDGAPAALVAAAVAHFGRVDVLVNNVGHFGGARKAFHEQTDAEWDDLYRVNLGHVLTCTRSVLPVLIEQGNGGSIVNVSTIEAFRAIPTRAVYSAFKSAITGFTRSVAVEYGRYGIRVNAIAPDVTETLQVPYSRWVGADEQHLIPSWVPLGRFGTAADTAGVALFLASELSSFVTGTTVHPDGGTLAASGWFPTEEGGWTNRPRRA